MTLPDNDAIEKEIRIAAHPETVFSFFTDPQKMMRWNGINVTLDPRPGGIYRVDANGQDVVRGEYIEVVPYTRIVFTWGWEGPQSPVPPGTSRVEVSLVPENDSTVTIVRVRHSGLAAIELRKSHGMGWDHYLERLVKVVEGKDPGPDPWAIPGQMSLT